MKVRIEITLDVNEDAWAKDGGPSEPTLMRADVKRYAREVLAESEPAKRWAWAVVGGPSITTRL